MLKTLKTLNIRLIISHKQLKIKKNGQSGLKSIGYSIRDRLPKEAIKTFDDLVTKHKTINYKKLSKDLGGDERDFTMFLSMGELLKNIYYGNIIIPGTEREQDEFYYKLENLRK